MRCPQYLSKRALSLKPSLTLAISAKAKALQNEGHDICGLSAGEPDFETPEFIIEAARKALLDGITRYGPAAGDPELRTEIAKKLTEVNNLPSEPDHVLVTNGGKQAIYNLLQVILNEGDEVLIPSPYWLSYPEMVQLAGGKVITIPSSPESGFKLDLEEVEKKLNHNTRLLIINTPGNPTGRVMQLEEMKELAEIVRRYPNLFIMSDEIYEYLLNEGETHYSFASIAPDLRERIFTVNGFAKGWAMTGWRIGYLAGNREVIKAATALQSQSTSNVCSFAQKGAIAALKGSKDSILYMIKTYNNRRELITKRLLEIEGLTLIPPKGAFYAFPQIPQQCPDSLEFCSLALEKVGLAIVPGEAFGEKRCIRLSCATSDKTILEGISRLKLFMSEF